MQTKDINCNIANKSCLLQLLHTKAIAASTQSCDFFLCLKRLLVFSAVVFHIKHLLLISLIHQSWFDFGSMNYCQRNFLMSVCGAAQMPIVVRVPFLCERRNFQLIHPTSQQEVARRFCACVAKRSTSQSDTKRQTEIREIKV